MSSPRTSSSREIPQSPLSRWLELSTIGSIFVIAAFAPHSIAVTQAAWLLGMVFWLSRFLIFPRPQLFRSPLDYLLLGFFILSGISGVFSYNPAMSIGKMRAASLFTIVYLVSQNIRSRRMIGLLALTLIGSSLISVLLTGGQLAVGRGVKVHGVSQDSPLGKAIFRTRTVNQPTPIKDGDIVWEVDGQRVDSAEELSAALAAGANDAAVRIYRVEWMPVLKVPHGKLLPGTTPEAQLGISNWTRGRDWRATGFFNHWVTFAEVIQLIASLAVGLFLRLQQKKSLFGLLLILASGGLMFALAMTVTRASWIGFAVSMALMLALSVSRRTLLVTAALAIPLILAGAFLLQQRRAIGFIDQKDQSTSWRQIVWREGFSLLVSKPRHLLVGVGVDSIKAYWRDWGLFDQGRQPIGHMHSNLLQIALERGVPALLVWFTLLVVYARMLFRLDRRVLQLESRESSVENVSRGVALGALGGLVGFFVSGLVHYNWGDSEVVTALYLIMGLSLALAKTRI
jgi:O-antigen ligase